MFASAVAAVCAALLLPWCERGCWLAIAQGTAAVLGMHIVTVLVT